MNGRLFLIRTFIIIGILVLSIRLFSLQVIEEEYKVAAENNIVQKITEYPYRGYIYDRNNELIVQNEPVYDLSIIPREMDLTDSGKVKSLLNLSQDDFLARYQKARRYSKYLSSIFDEMIPNDVFAQIQDRLVDLKGFNVSTRTVRAYNHQSLANVLGYVGEISKRQLQSDEEKYYRQGDIVGISGIEQRYEKFLRGKRGVSYKIVNVRGSVQGQFRDGAFDSIPVPGDQLQLTIDLPLQQYAERLMEGKIGSVVALDPRTGEILAFVSAPSYDPNLFSGRLFSENYGDIQKDSLKPLFNRPLQAMYPPGSMFKPVQALIAMQEKRLSAKEEIFCDGSLIGDLAPPGKYDVVKAITWSSNNYFVKIFRRVIQQGENPSPFIDSRIGMEKWVNYLENFGLGSPLGIDLANEKGGLIPGISVYDKIYGRNRWKFSNIYSLSIGQGEILVTPLQMANLGAIFANKGYYFTPHLVKSIGDSLLAYSQQDVGIESHHYEPVINGLEQVVIAGSARRAYIPDLQICGKTSTVQNPHGEDHSGFMGFAPLEDPQIAVAVYVENAGWGGRAAASTASLLIEKYVRGHITRSWIENYVLKGDFADEKRTAVESN